MCVFRRAERVKGLIKSIKAIFQRIEQKPLDNKNLQNKIGLVILVGEKPLRTVLDVAV